MPVQPYGLAHTILKLKAQPIAVKTRIVTMHNAVEGGRKDNDIRCVVIQRLREVFYVVSLHDALAAVCLANALSCSFSYGIAILIAKVRNNLEINAGYVRNLPFRHFATLPH